MKRCGGRIMVCLCLGAITTIVVAWVLACFAQPELHKTAGLDGWIVSSRQVWYKADSSVWIVRLHIAPGALQLDSRPLRTNADRSVWLAAIDPEVLADEGVPRWSNLLRRRFDSIDPQTQRTDQVRGWPMLALYSTTFVNNGGNWFLDSKPRTVTTTGAIKLQTVWPDGPDRLLPLQPLLVGFVVDCLFYGSAWFVLASLPIGLRHLIRRWRGVCRRCGYDLRHADHRVCPECGSPT